MDYKSDVEIDPDALDVEWIEQPRRFMAYAEEFAKAKANLDAAKEALDVIDAKLGLAIRAMPAAYKLDKVTESAVQAVVLLDSQHVKAAQRVAEAKFAEDIAGAAVRAMDTKKAALESLVRLHGQQYFAGPSVPRELGAKVLEQRAAKRSRDGVRARLNKEG